MATTRTPGITLGPDGRFFIDKRYRGIRIGMRIGAASQEKAEQRLRTEMQQVDIDVRCRTKGQTGFRHPRMTTLAVPSADARRRSGGWHL